MEAQPFPFYLSPAVWLPLIIFVPYAWVIWRRLRRDDPGKRPGFVRRFFLSPLIAWYLFVFIGVEGLAIGLFDPSDAALRWLNTCTLIVSGLAVYGAAGPLFVVQAEVRYRNMYGHWWETTPRLGIWNVRELIRDVLFYVSDEPPVEEEDREEVEAPNLQASHVQNSVAGSAAV